VFAGLDRPAPSALPVSVEQALVRRCDLAGHPGGLVAHVPPGVDEDRPASLLEAVTPGGVTLHVGRREMPDVAIDLHAEQDYGPRNIEPVFAVLARLVLDGRRRKAGGDYDSPGLGFQNAGRRGADEASVEEVGPELARAGAAPMANPVEFCDQGLDP
jgi:hypothetical protein